ncbi:MAG: DUF4831 family protein [Bacteroidales bacterium]|nr:DUF4831 family protein [Bacteroidales bacterium]
MKYSFAILCVLFAIPTIAQAQNVEKVVVGDNQNFGITYSLPKCDVCASLNMVCTKTVAGPFAQYAEKLLGITDAPQDNQTRWELISIRIDGEAVPDTTRTYHIEFTEKGSFPTFYFSKEGCLLSINREPETEVTEVKKESKEHNKIVLKSSDVISEDILKAGSKAKAAELTAKEIFSIRESKRDIVRGDVENMPKDAASLRIMLDNLDAQEKALLSMFTGTNTVLSIDKKVHFVPTEPVANKLYFRFSEWEGLVEENDLSGDPYYITIRLLEDNRMTLAPIDAKKKPSQGLAYNIPGKAHIELSYDGDVVAETDMYMGQFGHVEQLPVNQFTDKKKVVSAVFNKVSGSIRMISE